MKISSTYVETTSFQVKLYKDFMYDEDAVIQTLEKSMEDLKRSKLDLPGPPSKEELPSRPFGTFIEPSFEQIVGRRAERFSDKEKSTKEIVVTRRDEAQESLERDRERLSAGDSVGLAGTDMDNTSICDSITTVASSTCDSSINSSIYECTRL